MRYQVTEGPDIPMDGYVLHAGDVVEISDLDVAAFVRPRSRLVQPSVVEHALPTRDEPPAEAHKRKP